MSNNNVPSQRPTIPQDINEDEVLAIVSVHGAQAQIANQNIPHAKTTNPNSVHVFLRRLTGTPKFTIGRQISQQRASHGVQAGLDIYLPDPTVGIRQCVLQPVPGQSLWRLHSTSRVITTVNGAPLQDVPPASKRQANLLPKASYLKQSGVNTITVRGARFDIWLLKSAQEACQPGNLCPTIIPTDIQDVTNRPEQWARDRYLMTDEQVSAKTVQVIDRFNGDMSTAKVYQTGENSEQVRDAEFLLFSKADIDASIVRYQQATAIETIPAIITDTHDGFSTYEALRDDIHQSHPGLRFEIASRLVRRLFSALTWMHFNDIIHGGVSNDSVLLRLVDGQVEQVLLVDYSTAHPFVSGEMVPLDEMVDDGRMAMELIEDCCDIWALRNGPPSSATSDTVMRQRTQDLLNKHEAVKRVFEDYVRKGNSTTDSKGKKLAKLQDKLKNSLKSAHDKEIQNRAAREVANMSKAKIDALVQEWEQAHPPQPAVYKQYMLLSLGHPDLDSLANHLYVSRWDITPHEICEKLRTAGGDLEEPWQTFEVRRLTPIGHIGTVYHENPIMAWLATCCEVFPEWRQAIEENCRTHLQPVDGGISQANLVQLRDVLRALDVLPARISVMFQLMTGADDIPEQVDESYQIWYHIPSRLFNITQLQRLATPERLATTIMDGRIRCNNFVEVRGDPKIEGCYASLAFLVAFIEQLGLVLPQVPDLNVTRPTFDASDFSEIPPSRIVLARPGMVGYGSMLRTGDQANFLFSRTPTGFETLSSFIPTNFGDMKVLPKLPQGARSHERPDHWSQYRTADEFEAQANLSSRVIKKLVSRKVRPGSASASSSTLPDLMEEDETNLGQLLRQRKQVRAEARPPAKRDTDAVTLKPAKSSAKRPKPSNMKMQAGPSNSQHLPNVTMSFVQRAETRMQEPPTSRPMPGHPSVPTHGVGASFMSGFNSGMNSGLLDSGASMTDVADDEGLEQDWALVGKMLENVNEDDDPEVQGIIGFQIHDFGGSMMGVDQSQTAGQSYIGKGKGKAVDTQSPPTSAQRPVATMPSFGSFLRPKSGLAKSFRYSPPPGTPGPSTQSPSKDLGDSPAVSFMKQYRPVTKQHRRNPSEQSNSDDMPDTRPTTPVASSPPETDARQSMAATGSEQAPNVGAAFNFGALGSTSQDGSAPDGGTTQFFQPSYRSLSGNRNPPHGGTAAALFTAPGDFSQELPPTQSWHGGGMGTATPTQVDIPRFVDYGFGDTGRPNMQQAGERTHTPPISSGQPYDPLKSFGPLGGGLGSPTQENTPQLGNNAPSAGIGRRPMQQVEVCVQTPPTSSSQPMIAEAGASSPTQASSNMNAGRGRNAGNPLLGTPSRANQFMQDFGGVPAATADEDMPDTDGEESPTQVRTPESGLSSSVGLELNTGNSLLGTPGSANRFMQDIGERPLATADEDMPDTDGEESPTQVRTPLPRGSGSSSNVGLELNTGNPLLGTPVFMQNVGERPLATADKDMPDTDDEQDLTGS